MNTSPRSRHAFTLVELLVVITIIGILAGLITGAVLMARPAAKRAVVKMEIEQLAMALEHYKTDVGEYPPDFVFLQGCSEASASDSTLLSNKAKNEILRHLHKRFPRYRPIGDDATDPEWDRFCDDVTNSYSNIDPNDFTPASTLLFFLGGLPEQNTGDWIPAGFHQNPANPFQTGGPRSEPFFTFARERIQITGNNLLYFPKDIEAPYVYFKARSKEYGATDSAAPPTEVYPSVYKYATENVCVPYLEPPAIDPGATSRNPHLPTSTRHWRAPGKYQIITAGLDGQFGKGYLFRYTKSGDQVGLDGATPASPLTLILDEGNFDNLTNFAEGTLEDEMQ